MNSASSGDIITVKPGTYTENIKITKGNLTIRSESGSPNNTIIQAKSTGNVFLLQGNSIRITGFQIIGSSRFSCTGINLSSCGHCIIENNKLLDNSRGIYLLRSYGNTVSKNIVTNSGEYGIALQNATGNVVSENTASDNQRGVYFGSSDSNRFSGNTVRNNNVFGIFVCGRSDGNLIYNNYFNNANMTIRNGVGNAYNTTKTEGTNIVGGPYTGGNFWAKPDGTGFSETAVDKNRDGISDSVYKSLTGSKNTDYLPLVDPNSPAPIIPVTDFNSNVTSGNSPLTVSFTDKSTETPITWKWSFGDGTYSTVQSPKHTYSTAGNFTVTLTATNEAGSNTIAKSNYIKVNSGPQKPVVNFWGSRLSGSAPLTISFTDDSTNSPTAWKWNFGDGTDSNEKNPKHTYSEAGNYTVTHTATNTAGEGTKTKIDYIKVTTAVEKPVADFISNVSSGNSPLSVGFTDTSTGVPTVWNWSLGDGTYSTIKNPAHKYSKAGNYTVTLTVSNAAGINTATKPGYIRVTEAAQKPVVNFWGSRVSGEAPLNITFTDNSTGSPTLWKWSFGDGTYSTVKNPKHTYSIAGNYTVTLEASNEAGMGSKTRLDYIKIKVAVQKPVASFKSNVTSGNLPLEVSFTDTSTGVPTAWNWSFGDGTYSKIKNPAHTYSKSGNYTVALSVSNSADNNETTKSSYIKVTEAAQKPVVSFWGSRLSGKAPLTIGFTDASTGSPTVWKWSFGDGTYSTVQKPRHTYSKAGNYSVTLTASNEAGSVTKTRSNYIKIT